MSEPGDSRPILSVAFSVSAAGNEPVRQRLLGLSRDDCKTVGRDIKTAQYGWPLGMPLIRKLGPGLMQVRSHLAAGIARVVFAGRLDDLRVPPGNRLEALKGDRVSEHSIRVNDQHRVCFRWAAGGAEDVEIVDYH